MSRQRASESVFLERELLTLLPDPKSRNKALFAGNEDLPDRLEKQEDVTSRSRRNVRAFEKNKERLEGTVGALNVSTLKLENMVYMLQDERDVLGNRGKVTTMVFSERNAGQGKIA